MYGASGKEQVCRPICEQSSVDPPCWIWIPISPRLISKPNSRDILRDKVMVVVAYDKLKNSKFVEGSVGHKYCLILHVPSNFEYEQK